jgi:predicted component of type VI protein secretion system
MAPFDSAVMRRTAESRSQALRYNLGIIDRQYIGRLLQLFHFRLNAVDIDTREAVTWASLFPRFHSWSGNPWLVCRVLEQFFPWTFSINENVASSNSIPEELQYRLGGRRGRLGRETVLGRNFTECDSAYELVISEVSPQDSPKLFPGAAVRSKIEWVIQTCMPGNLDCRITVKVTKEASRLGGESGRAYLGFAAFVNNDEQENISSGR